MAHPLETWSESRRGHRRRLTNTEQQAAGNRLVELVDRHTLVVESETHSLCLDVKDAVLSMRRANQVVGRHLAAELVLVVVGV